MIKLKLIALLAISAGLSQAGVIQTISFDLSALHTGSTLSGSVILQNPLALGDSVVIPLTFSDPSDYTPTSLSTTLTVTQGVTLDQFRFSAITFTNLISAVNPALNNKVYTLTVKGAAQCVVDFPCTATGGFQANDPAAFTGTYTVTSATASTTPTPEPAYGLVLGGALTALGLARRSRRA